MRNRSLALAALAVLGLSFCWGAGPEDPPARELIDGIQDFENTLGFSKTHNFDRDSSAIKAYYRCYYTGPLELPRSYERLKLREGKESGCSMDPRKYDVFFYPVEAVASGKTPVTTSLARATPERVLVVVPHEDYHGRKDLPAAVGEAAATLVGFLTAADYARQQFGPASRVYQNLAAEPALFLRKSTIVNGFFSKLSRVYADLRAGRITTQAAFAEKSRVFAELRSGCKSITPDPRSFNKCLAAENNAGLAFDHTYTEFYPLLYALYESHLRDARSTIVALDRILAKRSLSEQEAAARLRAAIEAAP